MNSWLHKIQIKNFRNLDIDQLEFADGINCIFGKNGEGKTNLLEAIHFITNRRSFRKNTSFPQLISMDCEDYEILLSSVFQNEIGITSLSSKINNQKQFWYVNGEISKEKLEVQSIFINPFDSFQFHSIPSFRRNWIDTHIGILSKEYKKQLNKYTSVLRQRNNILSVKPKHFRELLKALDEQFVDLSYYISIERRKFLNEIKEYCKKTFNDIFSEQHDLELVIESEFSNFSKEEIYNSLSNNLEKELILGHTKDGVHRDNFIFLFDGHNSFEYCSLGQQKMSFLSLIFAYIELFRYKFISYPMVLIDDVSGELDGLRWRNLIDYLKTKSFQVFITTANENFKTELSQIEESKKFFVENGKVKGI